MIHAAFSCVSFTSQNEMQNHGYGQAAIAGERAVRRNRASGLCIAGIALVGIVTLVAPSAAQPAVDAARTAAKTATDLEATIRSGWKAVEEHRFADARQNFEVALKRAPKRMDAQIGLGEALLGYGDLQGALKHFELGAELAPEIARAHTGIGRVCLKLANREYLKPRTRKALLARAQAEFESVLKRNPKHQGARDGVKLVKLARWPGGRPLWLLELVVAALLTALLFTSVLRMRKVALPRWREYFWPTALFVGTRLTIFTAFAVAPLLLSENTPHPFPILYDPSRFVLDSAGGRWDGNLYAEVAFIGYRMPVPGSIFLWGTIGQFPLLPVLLRGLAFALNDTLWAAVIIPNVSLLLATLLLFDFFREQYGQRVAIGAICVMLVHPASLHGSVLYAESLALLGMVGLVLGLQRGAIVSAGLWGVFAGLARINALAVVPWLLFDAWRKPESRSLSSLLARISPIFGVAFFMFYLQLEFEDASAYFHEVSVTRFGDRPAFVTVGEAVGLIAHLTGLATGPLRGGPLPMLLYGFACLVIYVVSLFALLRERAFGPALCVASGIGLALGSNLASQPRYLWVLFPAAITIARFADRPVLRYALSVASLGGLFISAVAFARWYFVP